MAGLPRPGARDQVRVGAWSAANAAGATDTEEGLDWCLGARAKGVFRSACNRPGLPFRRYADRFGRASKRNQEPAADPNDSTTQGVLV